MAPERLQPSDLRCNRSGGRVAVVAVPLPPNGYNPVPAPVETTATDQVSALSIPDSSRPENGYNALTCDVTVLSTGDRGTGELPDSAVDRGKSPHKNAEQRLQGRRERLHPRSERCSRSAAPTSATGTGRLAPPAFPTGNRPRNGYNGSNGYSPAHRPTSPSRNGYTPPRTATPQVRTIQPPFHEPSETSPTNGYTCPDLRCNRCPAHQGAATRLRAVRPPHPSQDLAPLGILTNERRSMDTRITMPLDRRAHGIGQDVRRQRLGLGGRRTGEGTAVGDLRRRGRQPLHHQDGAGRCVDRDQIPAGKGPSLTPGSGASQNSRSMSSSASKDSSTLLTLSPSKISTHPAIYPPTATMRSR